MSSLRHRGLNTVPKFAPLGRAGTGVEASLPGSCKELGIIFFPVLCGSRDKEWKNIVFIFIQDSLEEFYQSSGKLTVRKDLKP